MSPYTISGEKCYLVPLTSENADTIDKVISEKELIKVSALYNNEYNFVIKNCLADKVRDNSYQMENKLFFIHDKDSNKPYGIVGVKAIDWSQGRGELIILLSPEKLKSKLSYEPVKLILTKAVNEWRIRRVSALTYKDDMQTQTVLKGFGFKVEGSLEEYVSYHNEVFDVNVLGLLKSSFHSVQY